MPDDPKTAEKGLASPGVESRGVHTNDRIVDAARESLGLDVPHFGDVERGFLPDLVTAQSLQPVTPRRARAIKERWGFEPPNVRAETFGELKEEFYQELISAVDEAGRSFVNSLASDPKLAQFARPCDEILGVIITILLVASGMIGSSVESAAKTVPEMIKLAGDVLELLGSAVQAAFASGERGEKSLAQVQQTLEKLSKVAAALKMQLFAWKTRFEKASTEMQSIMVGELTIEVLGVLKTALGVATVTGRVAQRLAGKLRVPKKPSGAATKGTGKKSPPKQGAKALPPSLRPEPTLKDSGWNGRPPGAYNNIDAARFAEKVAGKESIYVGPKRVEFDGYRAADRMLLDAKYASDYGFYDIGKQKFYIWDPSKKVPFQTGRLIDEAGRQILAMEQSGAAGIQWIINHQRIAEDLALFFSRNKVKITVVGPKGVVRLKP